MKLHALAIALGLGSIAATPAASATPAPPSTPAPNTPAWADGADVTEHLGAQIPLDLAFRDSTGAIVTLRLPTSGTDDSQGQDVRLWAAERRAPV